MTLCQRSCGSLLFLGQSSKMLNIRERNDNVKIKGLSWHYNPATLLAMHEGKNIHYSVVDQKPLCSFSGKVCNQRRLNKYGFCVRHILEDPDAPFKRCAYVAKSSKQTCTQPIPKNEERLYCNNHMQVMGMLPKRERKPKKEKEKPGTVPIFTGQLEHHDMFQNPLKARLGVDSQITAVGRDDVEDVYAFPTDPGEVAERLNHVNTVMANVGVSDVSQGIPKPVSYVPQKPPAESGSLAKIYPELAEKLEKIKPKVETKVKGKAKSSRTMNSLQTKIAQNRIKDKLKRNHESSASSQSQSPSSSFNSANSPGFHLVTSSPSVHVESTGNSPLADTKNVTLSEDSSAKEKQTLSSVVSATDSVQLNPPSITSLPGLQQGLPQLTQLNSLGFPGINLSLGPFGLPLPTASEVEETLKQLAKVSPVPMESALFSPEGAAGLVPRIPLTGLPPGTYIPTDLLTLHHLLRPTLGPQSGPPPPYPGTQNRTPVSLPQVTSLPSVSVPAHVPVTEGRNVSHIKSVIAEQSTQHKQAVTAKHAPVSVSNIVSSRTSTTASSIPLKSTTTESQKLSSSQASGAPRNAVKSSKSRTPRSKLSPVSSKARTPMALFSVPLTLSKTRKLRNILPETSVKKIKTESAIKYYRTHKRRKLENHHLLVSALLDSDDSDSSDCDTLPWQPDWFSASSDEDLGEDEDDDQSFDLRTTKLALSRARLRRQCFQSKKSYCANSTVHHQDSKSLSALIAAARENPRVAVKSVYNVTGNRPKPVNKYKRRGLEKRKCCYKNDDDVQCQNFIVPYTNHCSRHVMYNVDQQLFEYCTAKFADNTQCCVPVIDLKHELPLCTEHGIKADNYQKLQDAEPKPKRPRKKTKPSALTRPSRKGKKKKTKKKTVRPQKTVPPVAAKKIDADLVDTEDDIVSPSHDTDDDDKTDIDDDDDTPQKGGHCKMACLKSRPAPVIPPPARPTETLARRVSPPKGQEKFQKSSSLEELDNLGGLQELENEKMFGELPLETASRLLEENDFQDVLSRLPEETFDLFTNKNGMFEPTNEEVEELEKSIAMANKDFKTAKDSYDQITTSQASSQGPFLDGTSQPTLPPVLDSTSQSSLAPMLDEADELTKQIAEEILSQNLGSVLSSQSVNTADAQESIKAIARSLSTSGQFLAPNTSDTMDFDNQTMINSFQKGNNSVVSRTIEKQPLSQESLLRKDSGAHLQLQKQSSCPADLLSAFSQSQLLTSIPVPSVTTVQSSMIPTQPTTANASLKQLDGGPVVPVPTGLPSNLPLTQQQLLQLMSMRPQAPLQFQTLAAASPRSNAQAHQSQVPGTIGPQMTADQLLEKQRFIQQQKQELEAQQQHLLRQQQQLEALTQHKQQLDSLAQQQQQQQQVDSRIFQQLGTTPLLPPPPFSLAKATASEQQTTAEPSQPQVGSKPLTSQTQPVTHSLTTLPQTLALPLVRQSYASQPQIIPCPLPNTPTMVSQPLLTQIQTLAVSQPVSTKTVMVSAPHPTPSVLSQTLTTPLMGPQTTQPLIGPQPAQPLMGPQPTQPFIGPQPTQPLMGPQSAQPLMVSQLLPPQTPTAQSPVGEPQPQLAQPQSVSQPQPIVTQPGSVSNTIQPAFLSNLPPYVTPLHQLPIQMLQQDPKSDQVIQTAQLLELQQQLTFFAQHQQILLQQQLAMSQQNITQQQLSQQNVNQPNISQHSLNQQDISQQNISQQNTSQQSIGQQNIKQHGLSQQTIRQQILSQQSMSGKNSPTTNQQNVVNANPLTISSVNQQTVSNVNQQNVLNLSRLPVRTQLNFTNLSQQHISNLNQQKLLNFTTSSDSNQGGLIHGNLSAVAAQTTLTQTPSYSQIRTKPDIAISKFSTSHAPSSQETMNKNVTSSNQQGTQVQYSKLKQETKSEKLSETNSAKPASKKSQKKSDSAKSSLSGSPSASPRSTILNSDSSLLANIDTKTMTTKALEQHIVQMAYQQALAKQTEEDLERSKNPNIKKSGSKKNSQKGTKRNTGGSKKTKAVVNTPEMLRRQSELEEQLAQLAKQNMAQKQKTLKHTPVSQTPVGTDLFKHVTMPTTTISWKPAQNVTNKFPNGLPEDLVSKTNTVIQGVSVSNTVNLSSTVNLSLTTTSQLTARPITKHLGPPPSYHHTMTANLTKSSSAPS